jgi:hypothetical protein
MTQEISNSKGRRKIQKEVVFANDDIFLLLDGSAFIP